MKLNQLTLGLLFKLEAPTFGEMYQTYGMFTVVSCSYFWVVSVNLLINKILSVRYSCEVMSHTVSSNRTGFMSFIEGAWASEVINVTCLTNVGMLASSDITVSS